MSNLMELQGQIEKLQKQANDIKAREFDKTVAEIKAQMLAFGISVKDLTATRPAGKGKGKAAKPVRVTKANSGAKRRLSQLKPNTAAPMAKAGLDAA